MVLAISYFYAEVIFVNDVAPYTFLNWVCHIFIMDILIESVEFYQLAISHFWMWFFYFETSMYNQDCCNSLIAYLTITLLSSLLAANRIWTFIQIRYLSLCIKIKWNEMLHAMIIKYHSEEIFTVEYMYISFFLPLNLYLYCNNWGATRREQYLCIIS